MAILPETAALIARMSTPPFDSDVRIIDTCIGSLISAGLWAKLDGFWVPAQATEQAATLNWKADAFNLTVHGTGGNMPFTAYRGWNRTGESAGYISTGYNPSTAGGVYSQNSACIGAYTLTDATEGRIDMGYASGANLGQRLAVGFTGPQRLHSLNDTSNSESAATRSVGHHAVSRTASNKYITHHDNYDLGTEVASASVGLPNGELLLQCWNQNGSPASYTDRQYPFFHVGSGLTAEELGTLSEILETYLSTIGVTGYDVFMLAGQSNVHAGDYVVIGLDTVIPLVLQWRRGDYPGLYVDKADFPDRTLAIVDTISFALKFARDYYVPRKLTPGRRVILVPCSYGGTSLVADYAEWAVGGTLYNEAVRRTNLAMGMNDPSFKGILWMLGESDGYAGVAASAYQAALDATIAGFRRDIIGATNVPFISGNMPQGWVDAIGTPAIYGIQAVNAATASRVPYAGYANPYSPSVLGTSSNIHYSAADHRIYAGRFYDAWASVADGPTPADSDYETLTFRGPGSTTGPVFGSAIVNRL